MKAFEYCENCDAYLGSAVWGLFTCPYCDHKLALSKCADLEEDEDE